MRGSDYQGAYLYKKIGISKSPPSSNRFSELREILPKWAIGARSLKPVDWNGDGKWDMIFRERINTNGLDYFINIGTNINSIWEHKGLIPTRDGHLGFPAKHVKFLEVADWDGDGDYEILIGASLRMMRGLY